MKKIKIPKDFYKGLKYKINFPIKKRFLIKVAKVKSRKNKMDKLNFLVSRRFIGLVVIAVIGLLIEQATVTPEVGVALITVIGGFIGILLLHLIDGIVVHSLMVLLD